MAAPSAWEDPVSIYGADEEFTAEGETMPADSGSPRSEAAALTGSRTNGDSNQAPQAAREYLTKLDGPLSSVDAVAVAVGGSASSTTFPRVRGDGGRSEFVLVNGIQRRAILDHLGEKAPAFRPTIIAVSRAAKMLSPDSAHPTLGLDPTLSHHPSSALPSSGPSPSPCRPAQNEFPVYYFFYGTLCDPHVLAQVACLYRYEPMLRPARVRGGRLTTWKTYPGLKDAGPDDVVEGMAFLVEDVEQENGMRAYETEKYEVVRCRIEFGDGGDDVQGLTFRLVD